MNRVVWIASLLGATVSLAQGHPGDDRPSEDDLFGGGDTPAVTGPESQAQPPGAAITDPSLRDDSIFDTGPTKSAFDDGSAVDDPLRIGAQFYVRGQTQHAQGLKAREMTLSIPTLVDAYLDGRPTDRLRAFVSGRLSFDPTQPTGDQQGLTLATPGFGFGSLSRPRQNPSVLLDQAWLRFDILRTVFVTAGKQHVKWGTSRFFNPTDFLTPERRDPLLVFDPRVGSSMVKFHLPWESKGWNFYAIALLDNAGPANVLGQIGGAARAEFVFGNTEIGTGAVLQRGRAPRYALDFSSGLGPIDVYGELAILKGNERPLYRFPDNPVECNCFAEQYRADGLNPMASGGFTWTVPYSDTDTITLGAEYFYNSLGVETIQLYPFLIVNGLFTPFYTGRHYAAAYALLMGPGSWDDTSFVLSNLGNLSDKSFISRLDVTHRVLRELSVEAFGAVHYGQRGEFKLGGTVPSSVLPEGVPPFVIPEPTFEFGVGLRVNI